MPSCSSGTHISRYIFISTHIYTYIHIDTHIYTYIHTNWRNGSARRKCGTVPQKEFAYLYRRLKCLTDPQEHIYAHIYTYILISTHICTYIHIHTYIYTHQLAKRFCTKKLRSCSAEEIYLLYCRLKCLTVPQEHIYVHIYTYIHISTLIYTYKNIHIYTLFGETILHEESAELFRRRNLPICIAG